MKINAMHIYPFELPQAGDYCDFSFDFSFNVNGAAIDGIRCAISTVAAGDMRFEFPDTNPARLALFKTMGIESGRVHSVLQTHSRDVGIAQNDANGLAAPPQKADGLISCDPHDCLSVTVADCLPVYLYDTMSGAFAMLHSGWKGTGIAHNALALMAKNFNTKPEHVAAILGPCIQGNCYKVDAERAAAYEAEFGQAGLFWQHEGLSKDMGAAEAAMSYPLGPVTKVVGKNYYIDMQAANAHLLARDGVSNIAYCTNCTFTDKRLGSFRRQGAESFTKMIAIVGRF